MSPLATRDRSTTHGPAARRPKQAGTRRQPPHPGLGVDRHRRQTPIGSTSALRRRSTAILSSLRPRPRATAERLRGRRRHSKHLEDSRRGTSAEQQQQQGARSAADSGKIIRALLPRPWLQSYAAPAPSLPRAWQHWVEPSLCARSSESATTEQWPKWSPTRPISAPAGKCVEQQSASRLREPRPLVSLSPLAARHEALLASPTTISSPARLIEHRHARTSAATLGTRLDPRRQREREARDRGGPSSLGLVQARVALLLEVPHARASHLRASSSHRHRFVPRTRSQPHPGWSGRSGIFSSRLAARSVLLLPFHAVSARQISATHLEPDPEHTGGSSLGPA
jgi:hypothetical protein